MVFSVLSRKASRSAPAQKTHQLLSVREKKFEYQHSQLDKSPCDKSLVHQRVMSRSENLIRSEL